MINRIKGKINCPELICVRNTIQTQNYVSRKGHPYFLFNQRVAELYSWEESEEYTDDDESFQSAIRFFADISTVLDSIPIFISRDFGRGVSGVFRTEEMPFSKYGSSERIKGIIATPSELVKFEYAWERARNEYKFFERMIDAIPIVFIHGDLEKDNIGFKGNKAQVLYDFESVRTDLRIEDIAWAYASICGLTNFDHQFEKKSRNFWETFSERYPMDPMYREMIWFILLGRHLSSLYTHFNFIQNGGSPPMQIVKNHIKRVNSLLDNESDIKYLLGV